MSEENINIAVKENEIQAEDWVFSNLSELLDNWFDRFNERFFENALKTPVISFEKTRINSLGHFVIGRNAFGLKWNINVNSMYVVSLVSQGDCLREGHKLLQWREPALFGPLIFWAYFGDILGIKL
jgi:hypothetical protein